MSDKQQENFMITYSPKVTKKKHRDTKGGQDLTLLLKQAQYCKAHNMPPPEMNRDDRRKIILELLDHGMMKTEICDLLDISRDTLWRDVKRAAAENAPGANVETADLTAERINRRFDFLYGKAIKAKDWRLAAGLEIDRMKALQSIGMIAKDAERLEIGHTDATKEKAVEALLKRLDLIGTAHQESDQRSLPG